MKVTKMVRTTFSREEVQEIVRQHLEIEEGDVISFTGQQEINGVKYPQALPMNIIMEARIEGDV